MFPQNRAELVEFVKGVLGEIEQVRRANAELALRVQRGDRALRVEFTAHGADRLGVYLIPIPPEVLAVIGSARDPYNTVNARITVAPDAPATMTPEPEKIADPHEFKGRLDRWCEICNKPDRHPIHRVPAKASPPEGP